MRRKLTKEEAVKMLDLLRETYPDAKCALDHNSPWQLLVAVTLSAQTTDVSVNKITPALFEKYPTPNDLAEADAAEVGEIIRVIGMYKTKSQRIIDQAGMLVTNFGGKVPEDDGLLVTLPGVGRKTANVVMSVAYGHQRIAVDTHVFRLANRIGLAIAKNVEDTEEQLKKIIPKDRWTEAHHSLIFHGRNICTARKPLCDHCPIADICLKKGL